MAESGGVVVSCLEIDSSLLEAVMMGLLRIVVTEGSVLSSLNW